MTKYRLSKYNFVYIFITVLLLSSCSNRNKPAPVATIYGSQPLSERVKESINTSHYIVKKGETLYSIAWRANSDVRRIAQLNNISSPYNIYPGQNLILSSKKKYNPSKTSTSNASIEKSNKNSTSPIKNIVKKPIAPNKKQEYGKTVSEQKINEKTTFDDSGGSNKVRKWQWPATGKILATFSTKLHGNKGIDIAGRRGDKVKAAADGKVVYAGDALRGYGKLIIVKHNDDYLSAYAHNDKILIKEKQLVKAGDIIANMGDTDTQRVMLHFEVRFRGKSVNPMKYLPKK